MPAHRSDAEAEIREAVVAHLRRHRPKTRIIHEINAANGVNRIDVMAVGPAEIIAVEIKSERDKLDRLPSQIETMQRCSHITVAALHRKFMPDIETGLSRARPDCVPWGVDVWWHPSAQDMAEAHHPAFEWRSPSISDSLNIPLPPDAIHLLHRDELLDVAHDIGLPTGKRPNMVALIRAIQWGATGRQISMGICRALRARTLCAEADPAIVEDTR